MLFTTKITAKRLKAMSEIALEFYHNAQSVDAMRTAYNQNATPDETLHIMDLFHKINRKTTGASDAGSYILLGGEKIAETKAEKMDLDKLRIEYANTYAEIIGRTIPTNDLKAVMPELKQRKKPALAKRFRASNALKISTLCA